MKLVSCYIENFGKLSNFSYKFNNTLNVINEENGWGKSTFATFIKAMFYGLEKTKKDSLELNDRKKYQPWQGGNYGGNLVFEKDGKEFKIERFFGKKESEDVFNLIDLTTNKSFPESAFKNVFGEYLFKINIQGFENSLLLAQKSIEESAHKKEATASLSAKLNQGAISDDMTLFNDAISILDEQRKELKKIGNKGKIAEVEDKIKKINQQINENNQYVDNVTNFNEQIKTTEEKLKILQEKLSKLNKQRDEASSLLLKKEQLETLKKLEDKVEEEKNTLNAINRVFNGKDFSNEYLEKNYQLKNLFDRINTYSFINTKKTPVLSTFLIVFGLLFIIPAILIKTLFTPFICVSALFVLTGCILLIVNRKKTTDNKKSYLSLKNTYDKLYSDLLNYLSGFNFEGFNFGVKDAISEKLDFLHEANLKKRTYEESLLSKQKELEDFVERTKVNKLEEIPSINIYTINNEISNIQSQINSIIEERAKINTKIQKNALLIDEIDELLNKKEHLYSLLEELKNKFKTIEHAQKFLINANDNMRGRYLKPLKEGMVKYLNFITKSNIENITIDTDFNIFSEEYGQRREFNALSVGYRDLYNFAFRLALVDALFKDGEKPFIVLDDPFVNFDSNKLTLVNNLLQETANTYQIIYFICHESRNVK